MFATSWKQRSAIALHLLITSGVLLAQPAFAQLRAPKPAAPSVAGVSSRCKSNIVLTWSPVEGADTYQVQRTTDNPGNEYAMVGTVLGATGKYIDVYAGNKAHSTTYYQVLACSSLSGCSEASNVVGTLYYPYCS